jgi:hypothetical protein
VRFAKLGNQEQVGALSQSERTTIADGLSDFVGADFAIDPSTGELSIGTVYKSHSPTAVNLLRGMIQDPQVWVVYVMNGGWVQYAFTDTQVQYREKPVFLDLKDIASIKCTGRRIRCETFELGTIMLHEFVHAYLGLSDPPDADKDRTTGPTVDEVNKMRRERGLPERMTYFDAITSMQVQRGEQSAGFQDARGKRVGTVVVDMRGPFQELEAYRKWCQSERAAAAQAGRPSQCKGSAIWDKRPVP